jgi:hypothetical protein
VVRKAQHVVQMTPNAERIGEELDRIAAGSQRPETPCRPRARALRVSLSPAHLSQVCDVLRFHEAQARSRWSLGGLHQPSIAVVQGGRDLSADSTRPACKRGRIPFQRGRIPF